MRRDIHGRVIYDMASNKKPISQKRAEREQQENQALNRVFAVFLAALAAECYLLIIYRMAAGTINSMLGCYKFLGVITWVGLIPLIAGAAAAWLKRGDRRVRTAMISTACVGAFLTISGWIMTQFSNDNKGIVTMCALVPAAAVLALVFLLYQRECFLGSLALAGAMFAVWVRGASIYSDGWRIPVIAGGVLGLLLLAGLAYLARKAQGAEGKVGNFRLFSLECDYRVFYAILAAAFVCLAAALVVPAIAKYVLWVIGAALLAELAYYTAKMM